MQVFVARVRPRPLCVYAALFAYDSVYVCIYLLAHVLVCLREYVRVSTLLIRLVISIFIINVFIILTFIAADINVVNVMVTVIVFIIMTFTIDSGARGCIPRSPPPGS